MNKYTTVLNDGTKIQYARKDTAVKAGEASGQPYSVLSPSDMLVHTGGPAAPVEAPQPVARKTKGSDLEIAYTDSFGAKRFFPAMGQAAITLAESRGLTAVLDTPQRLVVVSGSKTEIRQLKKDVESLWTAAWAAFKEWKLENKERRAEQWLTNDGKRAMFAEECAFLSSAELPE